MKFSVKAFALSGLVLVACSLIVCCKAPTAATHKHEFKKELHKMERAH